MSNLNPAAGHVALKPLCDALGLGGQPVTKLVIECEVHGLLTVYVKSNVNRERVEALAGVLRGLRVVPCEDVAVDDRGEIQHIPTRE